MAKFIFVRHGESQANEKKIIGTPDIKLTRLGEKQAQKTGQDLIGKGIKTIFCSPFIRAQQTAEIIAKELGIDSKYIQTVDDLHERRLGDFEGKLKEHPGEWYFTVTGSNTEAPEDVFKRAHNVLELVKSMKSTEPILLVGHGAAGFYLMSAAKGITNIADLPATELMLNAGFVEAEI